MIHLEPDSALNEVQMNTEVFIILLQCGYFLNNHVMGN